MKGQYRLQLNLRQSGTISSRRDLNQRGVSQPNI